MREGAATVWAVLVGLDGVYIGISLRRGVAWAIPTLKVVARRENPGGFWALIGAAMAVLAGLLALALFPALTGWG